MSVAFFLLAEFGSKPRRRTLSFRPIQHNPTDSIHFVQFTMQRFSRILAGVLPALPVGIVPQRFRRGAKHPRCNAFGALPGKLCEFNLETI
jgi:hypothetical protein